MGGEDPKPGVYRHYKGGLYRLLMIVSLDESMRRFPLDEKAVVYVSLTHGTVKVRPLWGADSWCGERRGEDGFLIEPRFTWVEEQPS